VEGHDVIEEVEDPLEDIDDQVEDDDNMTIDDEYEQDEVLVGQEQHFGDEIHEHDEFIDHHLPMAEGDEDHENHGINLFVDLGPINYGVFMPPDEEIDRGRPSTYALENPNMRVPPTSKSRTILSTSNIETFSIPIPSSMPTHNIAPELRSNPSCVGSLRIHPPTPQHASLTSIIESQAKILTLLPDTPEFYEVRQEVIKQIHALESTLLESTGLAAPEQEENGMPPDVPNGEATVTPTTATISTVNTKGKKEVTILLTSDGNVLKDEMGSKFFQFLFHRAECLFGNTIQVDWRKQANSKKDELFEDVIKEFGNPGFNKDFIMDYARKFIHSKRDKIRSKLTNDLRYPRPAWITNQTTWDELIKDAKFKRKSFKNPNYMPSAREGGKRCLRDTTKATQARLSSIGSHKLGSGGYNSIRGSLVHHFRKEASDEDLKYALMHGSQGLRQHMIDRGEKLVIEHESEDVQQSNSLKGATDSEHEDATEGCDDFVAGQNESIDLLGTHLENNPEIQQTRVQDDYHVAPSIIVPRQKRTKKNRHFSYPAK
ncbi:hypothetical protein KI387_016124, partial [Taxus chinensis]